MKNITNKYSLNCTCTIKIKLIFQHLNFIYIQVILGCI